MNAPPQPPRRAGIAVALGCVFVVLLGVGGFGAFSLLGRFRTEDTVVEDSVTRPVELDTPVPAPPEPPPVPRAPRYRPGPYVQVVGVLPDGLSTLRRFAAANRGGRTVDNPWIVAGAELRPGRAPSGSPGAGPNLTVPDPNDELTVLVGAPAQLPLLAQNSQQAASNANGEIQGLLVEFEGYSGHFFVPSAARTELGTIQVAGDEMGALVFGIDAVIMPGGGVATGELKTRIRVAAVDLDGRLSPWRTRPVHVMPLGTGDIEVALTMDQATDLDLYVVDPSGGVTYYGNTHTGSGGQLDLDANAGCSGNMGVNSEHIFWSQGRAPAGTYQVRVAHFESCIQGAPVTYRLTVRNCGETAVFEGRFDGQGDSRSCLQDPGAARNWCQQVVSFDVDPCTQ